MNNMPCDVVKDLLPSYVDGLTSDTTNSFLEAHLEGCAYCKEIYDTMREPGGIEHIPDGDEQREIDFLKKNRKRNRTVLFGSIIGAIALLLAVLYVRFFVIGEVVTGQMNIYDIQVDGSSLSIKGTARSNAYYVVKGFSENEADGVVTFTVRGARKTLFYRDDETLTFDATYYYDEIIHTVILDGRIIWHDGARISALASDVYETRHEYMGNMSANVETANALCLQAYFGSWKNELLSDATPLTWKLCLDEEISVTQRAEKERLMNEAAYVLLAMTGNLDEVIFEYRCDDENLSKTVTTREATAFLGRDIKDCMNSARVLDELLHKTGLNTYARYDRFEPDIRSGIQFCLLNDTKEDIQYITYGFYNQDGAMIHSGGMMNADESPIKSGETLWFDFEIMINNQTGENALEFIVHTTDGKEHEVKECIKFPDVSGTLHPLILSGNAEDGFHITQD